MTKLVFALLMILPAATVDGPKPKPKRVFTQRQMGRLALGLNKEMLQLRKANETTLNYEIIA